MKNSQQPRPEPARPRAELAADRIAAAAHQAPAGTRLGSREDLRVLCGVSVGTLHEALRLLQATGEITVRPGPGGGVFAGERSALSGMLRGARDHVSDRRDFTQAARVLNALAPLVVEDAVASAGAAGARELQDRLAVLEAARGEDLRSFVRASLEVFATIVSLVPQSILPVMVASLLHRQIATLQDVVGPIDPDWRDLVEQHAAAVSRLVGAIVARDVDAALRERRDPEFLALFAAVHAAFGG